MVLRRETCTRSGRCSVLSAVLLQFINAAITRDSSPLLFLTRCHLLSLESYWKCLCVHPPVSLSHSSALSSGASVSLPPPSLSLPPQQCFFSLFADSASISLNPLCSAESFASSLSLLFILIWRVSCCHSSLSPCVQTSAALSDRLSAAASQGYVKQEMRKEVSGWHVHVLDTS